MQLERLRPDLALWDIWEQAAEVLAAVANLDPISRDGHLKILADKYRLDMDTLRAAAAHALDTVPWSAVPSTATPAAEENADAPSA
jgi:hypothetical protein